MRRFGLLALVVACGNQTAVPPRAPSPPSVTAEPAAPPPRHPGPGCPLVPLAPLADADRSEGGEGEARIAKPEHASETCAIADSNLARVEHVILTVDRSHADHKLPAWDHKHAPEFERLVSTRLALSTTEHAVLTERGFVVLGRQTFPSYSSAFHEIYQSQLPLFVSIDSVLAAIYAGNDSLIADLEDTKLRGMLADLLDKLSCTLPSVAADYPADTVRDLDLYLAVAQALLRGEPPASMFGDPAVDAEARALVKQVLDASEMDTDAGVPLFGRRRVIDFTAYTPRGHYAANDDRKRYFRAGMWLSRIEFNLVSRDSRSSQPGTQPDPRETPREELDALALADLIVRTRLDDQVKILDTAWALLAGKREDVSIADLTALRRSAGIVKLTDPDAAAKLRTAIGDKFQRTARLHYMPAGAAKLPAIATLLGPRVVPDASATRPLVSDAVPNRTRLSALDIAYALGHDRAKVYLADELAKYPTLGKQLDVARGLVEKAQAPNDNDLYTGWLGAVVMLSEKHEGQWPSYAATPEYADFRMGSAIAAYGQIKHNFALIAGESYFAGGCDIPDAYVEPATRTYAWLIGYAQRGERAMEVLDADGKLGGKAYFEQLGNVLMVLSDIQEDEQRGNPLSADERAFLSMVAEMTPGTTGGPPTYTGWYFDMFRHRELDGLAPADFIASLFTGDAIAYAGVTAPRLGVFVVDTGGPPRLMVGPVASPYIYEGPVAHRLDDAAARALPAADRKAPWATSYTVAAPPEPRLAMVWWPDEKPFTITTDTALGPVTVELYDHHRVALSSVTRDIKPGATTFPSIKLGKGVEGVHLRVGPFDGWYDLGIVEASIDVTLGGFAHPESGDDN